MLKKDRDLPNLSNVMNGRFVPKERLGSGSFGTIYKGIDTATNLPIAIKIGNKKEGNATLSKEARILAELTDGFGFPKMLYFGRESTQSLMVMNLLGYDLERLFIGCNYRFSLKTVLMLADQMLTRIEYLHAKGYIHRDVKPENFVLGETQQRRNVYLIDFGLSKHWRDPTGNHIPIQENKGLVGTARYTSISTHLGLEQSRRDDLESLGYVMLYFLKGKLPWQNLVCQSDEDRYEKIGEIKMKTTIPTLCKNLPKEFEEYLTYVRNLGFTDTPNYKYLRKLFRKYALDHRIEYDYNYDWTNNQKLIADAFPSSKPLDEKGAWEKPQALTPRNDPEQLGNEPITTQVEREANAMKKNNNVNLNTQQDTAREDGAYYVIKSGDKFKSTMIDKPQHGNMVVAKNVYTIKVSEVDPLEHHPSNIPLMPSGLEDSFNASKRNFLSNSNFDDEIPAEECNLERMESFPKQLLSDIVHQGSFPGSQNNLNQHPRIYSTGGRNEHPSDEADNARRLLAARSDEIFSPKHEGNLPLFFLPAEANPGDLVGKDHVVTYYSCENDLSNFFAKLQDKRVIT